MSKICYGCGLPLQSQNKDQIGYTPNINNALCERCFRLKNYGEKTANNSISNVDLIKTINKRQGIVFFLIDFLNINEETISLFKSIKLPKVLLISKCDILRKEMRYLKISNWLKKVYAITDDISFCSSKAHFSKVNILKYTTNRGYHTCYLMGITNAGKSTFLNNLLKENNINKEVLVSKEENTTLRFMKFIINNVEVYDTPGFNYHNLSSKLLNKEIKPISYNLKPKSTIIIDDKYYLRFNKANKIVCYLVTNNIKRNYQEYVGEEIKIIKNSDLVLPGLGFINIKDECFILTNIPKVEIRNSLSGDNYE